MNQKNNDIEVKKPNKSKWPVPNNDQIEKAEGGSISDSRYFEK